MLLDRKSITAFGADEPAAPIFLDGASVHRHTRLFIDRLNVKRPVYRHPRDEPPRANEILKSAALFSLRRRSSANWRNERLHRPEPVGVRGPADLQDLADCPGGV